MGRHGRTERVVKSVASWWRRRHNDEKQVLFVAACILGLLLTGGLVLLAVTGNPELLVAFAGIITAATVIGGLAAIAARLFPSGK